jgi:hypothetical protein
MKIVSGDNNMEIRKINQKATLLETELFKMILAIACIALLIILAVKLYGLFIKQSASEQAKETFEQLRIKMSNLQEGGKDNFLVTAPKDWVLMSSGDQLCICSFKGQSADFFRYENREGAWNYCFQKGFCAAIKNKISQVNICSWNSFINCFDFNKLPLTLLLENRGGIIYIMGVGEAKIDKIFESILSYKKDESSKSIKELIIDQIEIQKTIESAGFVETMLGSGPVQDSIAKQAEVSSSFESYLDKIDTNQQFNCNRDKLAWKMIMYKLNDKGETEGKWMPVGEKSVSYSSIPTSISKNQIDINGYRLMLDLDCVN